MPVAQCRSSPANHPTQCNVTVYGKDPNKGVTGVPGALQVTMVALPPAVIWDIVSQQFPAYLGIEKKPVGAAATDKNIAACKAAVLTLVGPPKVYNLEYNTDVAKRMGIPSNTLMLLEAMVAVNDGVRQLRAAVLQAEQDALALSEARGVFNHIFNGTAGGTYGEKLHQLIVQGFVALKSPHRGFMSSFEGPDDFGMSYELGGRLPDGYPRKLVLHVHCTYTGAVRAASIKYKDKERERGDGLALEPASLDHFVNYTYTNATVRGLLAFN